MNSTSATPAWTTRARWRAPVVLAAAAVLGSGLVSPVPAFALATTAGSSIDGGGYQNVIAMPPAGNTTYADHAVIGGDVSGFSRTSDDGNTWVASNTADA